MIHVVDLKKALHAKRNLIWCLARDETRQPLGATANSRL